MLGIDKNEKKRKHFTLCHENNEFRYHKEIEGRIYWACKVTNCPGMVEEENYKFRTIKGHVHIRDRKDRQTTKWQDNPWYNKQPTDKYKHDAMSAYNINNGLKMSRDHVQPDVKELSRKSSQGTKEEKPISRHVNFNMPSKTQSKPIPSFVAFRLPPGQLKKDAFDSGLDISDDSDSLEPVSRYRLHRLWVIMGSCGLLALIIVAVSLSLYFIDQSQLESVLPKQDNYDVKHTTVPASSNTTTERASQTPTQDNALTVTSTSPGGDTAESISVMPTENSSPTSTTSHVTSSTTTQTTPRTTVQTTPLLTVPVVFSGSLMLNKTWTAELEDKTTPQYQLISKLVVLELDTAFQTSPLRDLFNCSQVTRFSSGSVNVFFKITFHVDGQIDSSRVNATDVQQTIERETARQQTTRTNSYLSTAMTGSIMVKLANGTRCVYKDLFRLKDELTVIIN